MKVTKDFLQKVAHEVHASGVTFNPQKMNKDELTYFLLEFLFKKLGDTRIVNDDDAEEYSDDEDDDNEEADQYLDDLTDKFTDVINAGNLLMKKKNKPTFKKLLSKFETKSKLIMDSYQDTVKIFGKDYDFMKEFAKLNGLLKKLLTKLTKK